MIAHAESAPLLVRLAAPLAWRDDARVATKLMGFAATEEGSALDMLRAAELTADPKLQRLFFRHGLDEHRHALRFREVARRLTDGAAETRAHEEHHAARQDLFARWGAVRFVAFVWKSEARAHRQFLLLARRFRRRPLLGRLFEEIARDERVHVAYSRHLLDAWIAAGRGREVRRALRRVRLDAAWTAWRNAGRRLGDRAVRGLLAALWVAVVPWFALIHRRAEAGQGTGWQEPTVTPAPALEDLRRQF